MSCGPTGRPKCRFIGVCLLIVVTVVGGCDGDGSAEQAAAVQPTPVLSDGEAAVFEARDEEVVIRDERGEELDRFAAPMSVTYSVYDSKDHVVYAFGDDSLYRVDLERREVGELANFEFVDERCDIETSFVGRSEPTIITGSRGLTDDTNHGGLKGLTRSRNTLYVPVTYLGRQPHVDLSVEYRVELDSGEVTAELIGDTSRFCDAIPGNFSSASRSSSDDVSRPRFRQPDERGLHLDRWNCAVTFASGTTITFSASEDHRSVRCVLEVFDRSASGRAVGIFTTEYDENPNADYHPDTRRSYRVLDTENEEIIDGMGGEVKMIGAVEARLPRFHREVDLTLLDGTLCRLFPDVECREVQAATFVESPE